MEHTFAAPPEWVFDALADAPGWAKWMSVVQSCTSPQGGVGGTRRLRVHGGVVVDEEFIVWDRPHRWGFTIVAARPPSFRAGVEIAELSPTPGGGTLVRYRLGLECIPGLRPLMPIIRAVTPRVLGGALVQLDKLLAVPAPR
ncbi:MAG: SRPBCC family protein [Actinobacteria bacterium]|nr:SRPBCC family protein [Actinomycetota bacterium]